jgi:5S rRNA maturation endonuclease (ribonuclease M5)
MTARGIALEALIQHASTRLRRTTNGVDVLCPAHDDREPSLSLSVRTIGEPGALVDCKAGCPIEAVMEAWGLPMAALFDSWWLPGRDRRVPRDSRKLVEVYTYTDENGTPLFEVGRFEPKAFLQRLPHNRDWKGGIGETRRVLYRLPALIAAVAAEKTVYVVEGETDVHAVEAAGAAATCNPGGAGNWRAEYSTVFAGASVIVVADRDEAGEKHARKVASSLRALAESVRIVEAVEGKDARDHLVAGHRLKELTDQPDSSGSSEITVDLAAPTRSTAALLEAIETVLRRFVILPSDASYFTLSLFVLHTWAFPAAHATPYIVVESPEKQSGKSRLLEVLELVCRDPLRVSSITPAALFQCVAQDQPTLLIDESDAIFAMRGDRNEELRGVLNAGNRPGARVIRGGKDGAPKSYKTFTPKVLAGIATGKLPDTIRDRSIVVPMDRKLRSERVERLRPHLLAPELDDLCGDCETWATQHHGELFDFLPEPFDEISDRLDEAWEPLFAIAHLAGGAYPGRARAAARSVAGGRDDQGETVSHQLLTALRDLFGDHDRLSSAAIVAALNENDELPFGGWNDGSGMRQAEVARLLKRYRIRPLKVRLGGKVLQGYHRTQFKTAWQRY